MEEIDIIELLKRVKEGKAPKEIMIDNLIYEFKSRENKINELYSDGTFLWFIRNITVDTKIKILDKPIIEKLKCHNGDYDYITTAPDNFEIMNKINEIIDIINNKE